MIRIASFNLENLFTRPSAMSTSSDADGRQAIDDHATANAIVAKQQYLQQDKDQIITLSKRYGWHKANPPSSVLVQLQKIRGRFLGRNTDGSPKLLVSGRDDWTGWFELRRKDINWMATENTGRVIEAVKPDILIVIEVENRSTLNRFNEQVLGSIFNMAYPYTMVIDGNDDRGIDVGILSKFPIGAIRSHVDDINPNGEKTFSRDCPAYDVELPDGKRIVVLPNHFKSKRNGNDAAANERRRLQGARTHAIATAALTRSDLVLIGGDLNDTPDSDALRELLKDGFEDIQSHPNYPTDRPGTYNTGLANNKIDYLIMSSGLKATLINVGIERRGSYHPGVWVPFPQVISAATEASDHHLIWADFSL